MRSFVDLDRTLSGQPRELGATLARIDTGRGQQRLFEDQRPQLLRRLSEDARVASITASNALEGVTLEPERAEKVAAGARLRNRSEKEFAGYRDAIDDLLRLGRYEPLTVPLLLHLHRTLFHHSGGRGGHLKTEEVLIVSYEEGRRHVVFTPPPPEETEFLLGELLARYEAGKRDGSTHPLVLIGVLVLDLLAIHPFADGNGRLARLITTHELLSQGYGVVRYVSLEERIFASKHAYYASLRDAQRGWHESEHAVWPWISYLARILADAYDTFTQRMADESRLVGSKQDRVRRYIRYQAPDPFSRRAVERALPDVSAATIRLVLTEMRQAGEISAAGSGPGARWHKAVQRG